MKILLVEDEKDLADSLAEGLLHDGYQTRVTYDGGSALRTMAEENFDVVILDRDLPQMSGDVVCRLARASGLEVGILMLTAAASVSDRVEGLDLGADDYLTKPFAYVELLARLRALGRRTRNRQSAVLEALGVRLDTGKRSVERHGNPINLTHKEYGLLEVLLLADGGIVPVDELLEEVWGSADYSAKNVVKSAVYTLRKKLGSPDVVEAVPGRGYRIATEAPA